MACSRREFGGVLAGTVGSLACTSEPPAAVEAPAARKKVPIGVESWCFKELLAENPEATIAEVAQIGYEGIEIAHYYRWENLTAPRLRKALDANGLKCFNVHLGLANLDGDALPRTIEYNQTLGNSVLIVAWVPKNETIADWLESAKRFEELAAKVGEHGMRVGCHNRAADFLPLEGQVPWEVFFNNTSKEVIHQIDVGNMPVEVLEPVKYINMFPGRTQSIHVKDRDTEHKQALVGEGVMPFEEIFKACEEVGGIEWYIVEVENNAYPPLEVVKRCLTTMKTMLA